MERHADRLEQLLRRIKWLFPVIVLAVMLVMVTGFYFLQTRPVMDMIVRSQQQHAAEQVSRKVASFGSQIERVILTMGDWGRAGLLDWDDPSAFDRLMAPILRQRVITSSAHYARDDGREILLLKSEHGWKNRITDVPAKGKQQRWLEWPESARFESAASDAYKEQDYDPRKRPWFTVTQTSKPDEVTWTSPYIFQTTKDPGITAAMRWQDQDGKTHVVALDVMLADLSKETQSIAFGSSGYVALLTDDGKLLGMPKHPALADAAAMQRGMLKTPQELGLAQIAQAQAMHPTAGESLRWKDKDGDWLASLHPLKLGNQNLLLVTVAPSEDFSPWGKSQFWAIAALLLGLVVLVTWITSRVALGIGKPLAALFAELEDAAGRLQQEADHKAIVADLAYRLQHQETREACGTAVLSQLGECIDSRQAMLAVMSEAGDLEVVARYGAPAAHGAPARYALDAGLVGQCARDRQPIQVAMPTDPEWRIRSGLGSAAPAEVWLFAIEHGGNLVGVLELGLLHPLDPVRRALIDDALPVIALPLQRFANRGTG